MTSPTAKDIKLDIKKAASLVGAARRLLANGKSVDLAALEGRVRTISTDIGTLAQTQGKEAGKALLPPLESLMESLSGLERDIETQFRGLTAQTAPSARQAAKAYRPPKDKT